VTALDLLLLGVALVSTALGLSRGLVREVFGVVSLALALLAAYLLGPVALVVFVGADAGPGSYLITCAIVFVVTLVALSLAAHVVRGILKMLRLGGLDRLLGGIFGVARALLVTVAALTALVLVVDPRSPALRGSFVLRLEAPAVEWVGRRIPHEGIRDGFARRWERLGVRRITLRAAAHSSVAASKIRLAR